MKRSLIYLALLSSASFVFAADVQDGGSLSLDEAIRLALDHNAELAVARVATEEARAAIDQAGRWPNPELELDGKSDALFAGEGEESFGAGVVQPISFSGRIAAQRGVANWDLTLADGERAEVERKIIAEVRRKFVEALVVEQRIVLQQLLVNLNEKSGETARAAFARAEASEKDVSAVEIELQQTRQRQGVLEMERRNIQLNLNTLVGRPLDEPFRADGSLGIASIPYAATLPLETALEHRPDYLLARHRIERAKADLRLAKSERYEDARIGAGYEREQSVVDGSPPQGLDQFIGVRLSVSLPLFDRKQGLIRQRALAVQRAEKDVDLLRLQIARELADARNRIESPGSILSTYALGILQKAEVNARFVEQGYQQGQSSILDVLQSRQQLAELQSSYIDLLQEYHLAIIDFETAAGIIPREPQQESKFNESEGNENHEASK